MLKLSFVAAAAFAIAVPLDAQKVRLDVLLPQQTAWADEPPAVDRKSVV